MYLIGAGGHAKVIIDILLSCNIKVKGVFDSNPILGDFMGIPYLGHEDKFEFLDNQLIISIGDNLIRKKVAEKFSVIFGRAVHFSSIISDTVNIGEGTIVAQGAVIQSSSVVKKHVIINTSASIDHDCFIDNFAHISPGAVLCGNVCIAEGAHIGAGAVCLPGVKIGHWSIVGAGSIVTKDIPDGVIAFGNPIQIR